LGIESHKWRKNDDEPSKASNKTTPTFFAHDHKRDTHPIDPDIIGPGRVRSLIALASVLFVLFAGYWNMLGWRF
jgi:hypothetical protein